MKSDKKNRITDKDYPAEIFITREVDGADAYLIANENLEGFEGGERAAVYKLIGFARVVVERYSTPE